MTDDTTTPFEPVDTSALTDIVKALMFHPKLLEKANVPEHVDALRSCLEYYDNMVRVKGVDSSREALCAKLTELSEALGLAGCCARVFVHAEHGVVIMRRWDWLEEDVQARVDAAFSYGKTVQGALHVSSGRVVGESLDTATSPALTVRHAAITLVDDVLCIVTGFPSADSISWWALGRGLLPDQHLTSFRTKIPKVTVCTYDASDLGLHLAMGGSIGDFLLHRRDAVFEIPSGVPDPSEVDGTVNQSE